MIFKCLDGALGSVHTMVVWFHKLNFAVVGGEELFYGCAGLVISDIEHGYETIVSEHCVDLFEGVEDNRIGGDGNWNGKDVVGIVVVCHEEVLIAIDGAGGKGSCAICV